MLTLLLWVYALKCSIPSGGWRLAMLPLSPMVPGPYLCRSAVCTLSTCSLASCTPASQLVVQRVCQKVIITNMNGVFVTFLIFKWTNGNINTSPESFTRLGLVISAICGAPKNPSPECMPFHFRPGWLRSLHTAGYHFRQPYWLHGANVAPNREALT